MISVTGKNSIFSTTSVKKQENMSKLKFEVALAEQTAQFENFNQN